MTVCAALAGDMAHSSPSTSWNLRPVPSPGQARKSAAVMLGGIFRSVFDMGNPTTAMVKQARRNRGHSAEPGKSAWKSWDLAPSHSTLANASARGRRFGQSPLDQSCWYTYGVEPGGLTSYDHGSHEA